MGLAHVGYVSNPEFLAEEHGSPTTSEVQTASSSGRSTRRTATPSPPSTTSVDAAILRDGRRLGGNGQDRVERLPRDASLASSTRSPTCARRRAPMSRRRRRGSVSTAGIGPLFLRAGIGYGALPPQGHDGAQATRRQLGLPLPAAHGCHRGERAPEATRRREAREAPRFAAREDDRPARPGIQAEHERHARSAEPDARVRGSSPRARSCAAGTPSRSTRRRRCFRGVDGHGDAAGGADGRGRSRDRHRVERARRPPCAGDAGAHANAAHRRRPQPARPGRGPRCRLRLRVDRARVPTISTRFRRRKSPRRSSTSSDGGDHPRRRQGPSASVRRRRGARRRSYGSRAGPLPPTRWRCSLPRGSTA